MYYQKLSYLHILIQDFQFYMFLLQGITSIGLPTGRFYYSDNTERLMGFVWLSVRCNIRSLIPKH